MLNPFNWFNIRFDYGFKNQYYLVSFGPGWTVLVITLVYLHFFI